MKHAGFETNLRDSLRDREWSAFEARLNALGISKKFLSFIFRSAFGRLGVRSVISNKFYNVFGMVMAYMVNQYLNTNIYRNVASLVNR